MQPGAAFPRMRFFTILRGRDAGDGAYPETHGIVADSWYDTRSGESPATGARQLPTPTSLNAQLADELNLATAGVSIVSIADDPRLPFCSPAIGRWFAFTRRAGRDSNLSYYAHLPQWAAEYDARNRSTPLSAANGGPWGCEDALPLRVLKANSTRQYLASPLPRTYLAWPRGHRGRWLDDVPDLLISAWARPGC
jgi:hypothetical protein